MGAIVGGIKWISRLIGTTGLPRAPWGTPGLPGAPRGTLLGYPGVPCWGIPGGAAGGGGKHQTLRNARTSLIFRKIDFFINFLVWDDFWSFLDIWGARGGLGRPGGGVRGDPRGTVGNGLNEPVCQNLIFDPFLGPGVASNRSALKFHYQGLIFHRFSLENRDFEFSGPGTT